MNVDAWASRHDDRLEPPSQVRGRQATPSTVLGGHIRMVPLSEHGAGAEPGHVLLSLPEPITGIAGIPL